jgi:hypothetical protein
MCKSQHTAMRTGTVVQLHPLERAEERSVPALIASN